MSKRSRVSNRDVRVLGQVVWEKGATRTREVMAIFAGRRPQDAKPGDNVPFFRFCRDVVRDYTFPALMRAVDDVETVVVIARGYGFEPSKKRAA